MKAFIKILIVVCLLGGTVCGAYAMGSFVSVKDPLIGQPAPDFTLQTLDGQKNFAVFRAGQKAIVFFWATWCPHCREALKDLNIRREEFAQKNISLVIVDVGEKKAEVVSYLNSQGIQLNIFLDEQSSVSEQYRLIGVPTIFFVDAAGIIKDVHHGLPEDLDTIFN